MLKLLKPTPKASWIERRYTQAESLIKFDQQLSELDERYDPTIREGERKSQTCERELNRQLKLEEHTSQFIKLLQEMTTVTSYFKKICMLIIISHKSPENNLTS